MHAALYEPYCLYFNTSPRRHPIPAALRITTGSDAPGLPAGVTLGIQALSCPRPSMTCLDLPLPHSSGKIQFMPFLRKAFLPRKGVCQRGLLGTYSLKGGGGGEAPKVTGTTEALLTCRYLLDCAMDTSSAYGPTGGSRKKGPVCWALTKNFAYLGKIVPTRNQIVYPDLQNGKVVQGKG